MPVYLVVGQHSWSKGAFADLQQRIPDAQWKCFFDNDPKDLPVFIQTLHPDKVFFLHWSYIVPDWVVNNVECICFHPSHLPYGRGGTPIQNLIVNGFGSTKLTAFKMTSELDAGPIYLQTTLPLSGLTAQDIYKIAADLTVDMVEDIIKYDIKPVPQEGEPVYFKRRTPEQSEISGEWGIEKWYDHIRMLSAENYPHAFIEYGDYIIEFVDPFPPKNDSMLAHAVIIKKEEFSD